MPRLARWISTTQFVGHGRNHPIKKRSSIGSPHPIQPGAASDLNFGLEKAISYQYYFGLCYKNGDGVPKDDVLAYMWFNLGGASGDSRAKGLRDVVSKTMTQEQIAEAQKLSRQWKPKAQ